MSTILAGRSGVTIPVEARDFSPERPHPLWGPPGVLFSGYHDSFLGLKRPGTEFDHSSPSSADVKNGWHYKYFLFIRLRGVDRDNFIVGLHPQSPRHLLWQPSRESGKPFGLPTSVTWLQLLRKQTNTGTSTAHSAETQWCTRIRIRALFRLVTSA